MNCLVVQIGRAMREVTSDDTPNRRHIVADNNIEGKINKHNKGDGWKQNHFYTLGFTVTFCLFTSKIITRKFISKGNKIYLKKKCCLWLKKNHKMRVNLGEDSMILCYTNNN